MGLPEDELARRGLVHRGVYCRPGLLVPSDTSLYALLPAQALNACLPLGPGRRVLPPSSWPGYPWLECCGDTGALRDRASLTHTAPGDGGRAFYVLQLEADLMDGGAGVAHDVEAEAEWGRGGGGEGAGEGGVAAAAAKARARGAMCWKVGPGGVNAEAVARIWLARRDPDGRFVTCDPPTGVQGS